MSEINILIKRSLEENLLISGVLSNPRKGVTEYKKVTVKPVVLKEELKFQFAYILDRNTVHKNLNTDEAIEELKDLFNIYKQGVLYTGEGDYQLLINKKGKVKIIKNKPVKPGLI